MSKVTKGGSGKSSSSRGQGPVRYGSAASVRVRTKKPRHKRVGKKGKRTKKKKKKR